MKIAVIIFVVLSVIIAGAMLTMAMMDLWDERKRKGAVAVKEKEQSNNDSNA